MDHLLEFGFDIQAMAATFATHILTLNPFSVFRNRFPAGARAEPFSVVHRTIIA